ncbi:RHS repeat-associated core domain-containing protein [Micromonospora sp. WMMD998]|uniref:RHS repeat domain-containing protein n=1 Tax=Micromonospora sp. WMMD998 TaxID=3016092 RepID=UPI00249A8221|nr:RHS repeat-associated core domain-containing protein [Micromonospora sp. WMMD998]WFE39254.1 RHS repeat-associated core domain-containing protein [Micromonospora sp. WMMD998]
MLLAVTLLPFVPAYAAPSPGGMAARDRSVRVSRVAPRKPVASQSSEQQWKPSPGRFASGGSLDLEVAAAASATGRRVDVGGLPVSVTADGSAPAPRGVHVQVFDQGQARRARAAAVVRIAARDTMTAQTRSRVEIDYSGLTGLYGSAWASRGLNLVSLQGCVTDAAGKLSCRRATPLPTRNDRAGQVVSAAVEIPTRSALGPESPQTQPLDGAMVALVAGAAGQTGTFLKTSLSASASWTAGSQSGDFSWSYDMDVPESAGDLNPEIALSYSSGRVDGQTNGENTQTSWIGEGWDYHPGYIERSYRTCKDDLANAPAYTNASGDLCWRDYNATLMLDGKSTELILDDATQTWRLADDDGSKIEYLKGGTSTTRNWSNERWRLTTPDGTRYTFGANWVDSRETFSVQGVPVFSNHSSDPCYKTGGFAGSWCAMGYRWNLDLEEDTNGNVMSYFYSKEYNKTSLAGNTSTLTTYDRAATLSRIEYGSRGFPQPTTAPLQVVFTPGPRCLSSCGTEASPTIANWPETPWDLDCPAAPCAVSGPTFWSARRLQSVTAQVLRGGTHINVDTWTLTHLLPSTGETQALTSPALWLDKISHTGGDGTTTSSLPDITFGGNRYANRTDHNVNAGVPVTNKYRITAVNDETGSQTLVTYEGSDCTVTAVPADSAQNGKRCFPQYYSPPDNVGGWSWWNKYRVKQVVERDNVGGSPDVTTTYAYATTAVVGSVTVGSANNVLWHHNDNAWALPLEKRSWSEFRGWPIVTVTRGASSETQSQSMYVYFRGMNGDRTDAGERTRTAAVVASDNYSLTDFNSYAGLLRERIDFATPGGQPLYRQIYGPWQGQTAKRVEPPAYAQPTTFEAFFAQQRVFQTHEWIAATGTWRSSEVFHRFDATYGTPTSTTDNGVMSVAGDETCTTYTYARNTVSGFWLTELPAEEITTDCTANPAPANVLAGSRTYYDGTTALGAAPTKGLETRVDELASYTSTTPNWITTEATTYDAHGRVKTSKDGLNRTTTFDYVPVTGSPVTGVTETNPAGHTTTDTLDLRGQPTSSVDANTKTTVARYDPLGRLTKLWLPGRPTSQTPNTEYAYSVTKTAPTTVQTKTLGPNGNQISSYEIYDGHLRPRQTQTTAPDGKRVIGDTRYNTRGLEVAESAFYNNASAPTGTLYNFADADVSTQRRYTYDGLERPTVDALWAQNVKKWETLAAYDGNRVDLTPPAGGTPVTLINDAQGNITAKRQYQGASPSGTFDETSYGYDLLDRLTSVTDAAGNTWTHAYDRLDRLVASTDPDAGNSSYTYDDADQLTTTTDGRGEVLFRAYDPLGRPSELRDDSATGNLRASWTYDTLAKGYLTSATRHDTSGSYTQQVTGYTDLYQPTGQSVLIPASQGALAGTYTTGYGYHADGSLATTDLPAKGGLPTETVTNTYTDQGYVTGVTGLATYLASTQYYWHGAVKQQVLGSGAKRARFTTTIDDATGRLTALLAETENQITPDNWDEKLTEQYRYDAAGNVTSIAETNASAVVANQCFGYDYLQRLTEAWTTSAATCQSTPSQAIIGGADSYWSSYTYDKTGNRTTDTRHATGGDITRTYAYPNPASNRPHALTSITTNGGEPTTTYTYDTGGYLKTRTATGKPNQTLTFDAEGDLTHLANGATTHTYVYDAAGNRLIADNPGADKTLYLDDTEYHLNHTTGQVTGTRYYPNAVRTPAGLTWTAANPHGTNQLAINSSNLATTRRRLTPFGEDRGAPPSTWPDKKGFVGGTTDPTGYTHLGAREYDPNTGRFLSVDPLADYGDPQTLHGYAYSNNSPITYSDSDGLMRTARDVGGGGSVGGGGRGGARIPTYRGPNGGATSARAAARYARTPRMNPRQEAREMRAIKDHIRSNPNKNRTSTPSRKYKPSGGRNGAKGNSKGKTSRKGGGTSKGTKSSRSKGGSGKSKGKGKSGGSRPSSKGAKSKPNGQRKPSGGRGNKDGRQDVPEPAAEGPARVERDKNTVGDGLDAMPGDVAAGLNKITEAARIKPGSAGTAATPKTGPGIVPGPQSTVDLGIASLLALAIAVGRVISKLRGP